MSFSYAVNQFISSTAVGTVIASHGVVGSLLLRGIYAGRVLRPFNTALIVGIPAGLCNFVYWNTPKEDRITNTIVLGVSFLALNFTALSIPELSCYSMPWIPAVSVLAMSYFGTLLNLMIRNDVANKRDVGFEAATFAVAVGYFLGKNISYLRPLASQPLMTACLAGIPFLGSLVLHKKSSELKKTAVSLTTFVIFEISLKCIPSLVPFSMPFIPAISAFALGYLGVRGMRQIDS